MKPPWGHSRRVLPTFDTGEDLVGLLQSAPMTETYTFEGFAGILPVMLDY